MLLDTAAEIVIPYKMRDAFRDYHHREQRYAVNVCHRRAGKTVAAVNELIYAVHTTVLPRPRCYYISPTYAQSKKVCWDYAKHYSAVLPGVKFYENELRIDYPNGKRLQLLGAENVDSLRGIYADSVVLDEFAFMSPEVWTKIIRPALSDRNGRATFISSVNGRNEFYRLYKAAEEDPEQWFSMNLKADTSGILPASELAALKREMPDEDYRQEYLNDFDVAAKGSYYGSLISRAEEDGRVTGVPYDGAVLVDTAWDLGVGDPTAIWFVQQIGRELHCIDYYENSGQPLAHYVSVLKHKGYEYGTHYLPHDASARELGSGKTRVEMLAAMDLMSVVTSKMKVDDQISATRAMLPRMWFDKVRCADALEKLRQYRAAFDEKKQVLANEPLHDFTSHCASAMHTFCIAHHDRRPRTERPPMAKRLGWIV